MPEPLRFTVPLTPPSANHYKIPVWKSRRFVVTTQARAFMDAVITFARIEGFTAATADQTFATSLKVFLGKGERLDAGNAEKCVLDALEKAGVFCNDSQVKRLVVEIDRDRDNPRTEITVEAM